MTALFVIDALNYIFRSYWGLPPMKSPDGKATQALYGMIRGIQKIQKEYNPSHLVVVFDGPDNSQSRREYYPEYKSHRSAPPEDLIPQIKLAHQALTLMGIPFLELSGVEADDTIGSIATWASKHDINTYICSSDKDLCQLINPNVTILQPHKNLEPIQKEQFISKYGITPDQMIDYLAITGDNSDNIPGLSGFGPKTASSLLKSCMTLDVLQKEPEKYLKGKKLETFKAEQEKLNISKRLATIDIDLNIPKQSDFYQLKESNQDQLNQFYLDMGFKSMVSEPIKKAIEHTPESIKTNYITCLNSQDYSKAIKKLSAQSLLAIDLETTSLDPLSAKIIGIGMCYSEGSAFYFALNADIKPDQAISLLKPLLEKEDIQWIGHNIKYDFKVLRQNKIIIANPYFDTMIGSYLINPEQRRHGLDHLCLEHFNYTKVSTESLIGKGKSQISFSEVPIEKASFYCCEDVDFTWRLYELFSKQLEKADLLNIFHSLEMPLVPILAHMELEGISLDTKTLNEIGTLVHSNLKQAEDSIYNLAGESFNINSPKQLAQILFEKLQLPPPKKTKTGSYSTNVDVLTQLSSNYTIAKEVLNYRALEKLRSTYIEKLPLAVNPDTGKIHCSFSQTTAATGRLSCTDPNLQNIPIRTELGRSIRKAFTSSKDNYSLVSADYSQIELRLLAHFSQDPNLLNAFNHDEDIHTHTASLIFQTPIDSVTKEMRYSAKAVNFGVIYGQKAFGLAQDLNIPIKEASQFIKSYYEQYPSIKTYLNEQIDLARISGNATTYLGRKRPISDINSKNAILKAAAERLAINTPLQGSAADLIKEAMIKMHHILSEQSIKAKLLLQVHDELIYEVPDADIPNFTKLLQHTMENIWDLSIPLKVNVTSAKNWQEL